MGEHGFLCHGCILKMSYLFSILVALSRVQELQYDHFDCVWFITGGNQETQEKLGSKLMCGVYNVSQLLSENLLCTVTLYQTAKFKSANTFAILATRMESAQARSYCHIWQGPKQYQHAKQDLHRWTHSTKHSCTQLDRTSTLLATNS
jgi:hypothetical protein